MSWFYRANFQPRRNNVASDSRVTFPASRKTIFINAPVFMHRWVDNLKYFLSNAASGAAPETTIYCNPVGQKPQSRNEIEEIRGPLGGSQIGRGYSLRIVRPRSRRSTRFRFCGPGRRPLRIPDPRG